MALPCHDGRRPRHRHSLYPGVAAAGGQDRLPLVRVQEPFQAAGAFEPLPFLLIKEWMME